MDCKETFYRYAQNIKNLINRIWNSLCNLCNRYKDNKDSEQSNHRYEDHIDLETGMKIVPEEEYNRMLAQIYELEKKITKLKINLIQYEKDKIKTDFKNRQTIIHSKSTQTNILTRRRGRRVPEKVNYNENIKLTISMKTINKNSIENIKKESVYTEKKSDKEKLSEEKQPQENSSEEKQPQENSSEEKQPQENSSEENSSEELSSWDEISTKEELENNELENNELENNELEDVEITDNKLEENEEKVVDFHGFS